jgi:hypothetical protein
VAESAAKRYFSTTKWNKRAELNACSHEEKLLIFVLLAP